MEKRCLLSVAMIVKDEEHNIRRALESVKNCVDEIVVVDTGSKDRTPEIVKEYTDKLYFHEWRNDFSEARNYSLKFPTCEWVMILDADEEVSKEFCENIRSFLESLPDEVNTIYVPTISYLDWDFKRQEFASTARIFRNGTVHYENIVHNKPVYKPKVEYISWPIYHYGYIWTRKLKKKKYERTATLIREFLKRKDLRVSERIYYLVQLYKTEAIGGKPYQKSRIAIETYKEISKSKMVPTIAMEFFYYFAGDLMRIGLEDIAEEFVKKAINLDPDYPDLYYIMIGFREKKEDWDGVIEYGKKFLKAFKKTLESSKVSSKWTVNAPKVIGSAYAALARAYLRKEDPEKAHEYIVKSIEHSLKSGENIEKFLMVFLDDISKVKDKDVIEKISKTVEHILEYSKKKDIKFDPTAFIEKAIEFNVNIPDTILDYYEPRDPYQEALKRRITDGKDHLLDVISGGKNLKEFIEEHGPNALVFAVDVLGLKSKDTLRLLNELRKLENDRISGLSLAFIGDYYLQIGRFKEAVMMYKKSIEKLPEISNFVKPVIEDLKSRLESDIEGVFDEIYKYYSKGREFIFDVFKIVPKQILKKIHLVSDSDQAFYISAAASDDHKEQRKFLGKIKKKDHFPFYYFRLAKTYEKEKKWKEAYIYHMKACEENEKLGDLRYSTNIYHGLYLSTIPPFHSENDEIVWSGNISETFSPLGIIDPVRMWRRSKDGFFYIFPYHVDKIVDKYFEMLKNYPKLEKIEIDPQIFQKYLIDLDSRCINLKGIGYDEKKFEELLKILDIDVDNNSDTLFIPFGLETMDPKELEHTLKNYKRGMIVFFSPSSLDSKVWKYPPFRILRPIKYMKNLFKSLGFKIWVEKLDILEDGYVLIFKG